MRRGIEASEAHHPAVVREGTCRPLHLRDTTALSIARLTVETEDASFRLLSTAPAHAGSVGRGRFAGPEDRELCLSQRSVSCSRLQLSRLNPRPTGGSSARSGQTDAEPLTNPTSRADGPGPPTTPALF